MKLVSVFVGVVLGGVVSVQASELHLLGLKINHSQMGNIDALWQDGHYYISLTDLSPLDTTASQQADGWHFDTPLRQTVLASDDVVVWQNMPYLSFDALGKLGIRATYSPSDLHIHLMRATLPKNNKSPVSQPKITHFPSKFGVQGVHFDTQMTGNDSFWRYGYNLDAFGYAMGGSWGVATAKDNRQKTVLDNAYWAYATDQTAIRLGSSSTPFETMTGVDLAYSNANIKRHLTPYLDGKTSSLLNTDIHDLQHIKGVGVAGGVAKLRINGVTVATVQSLLDGRYEFLNLDMSAIDRQSLIEVAIFDTPYAQIPVSIQAISLGRRESRVATDELLVQAGLGRVGVFDDKGADTGYAKFAYGVNNKLSINAGASNNTYKNAKDQPTLWQVGANIAPNRYTNIVLDYKSGGNYRLDTNYERTHWRGNYRYSRYNHQTHHHFGLYYTPNHDTHLSIIQDDNQTNIYARTRINDHISHDVQYGSKDDYWRYRISQDYPTGKFASTYAYSIDPEKHHLSSSHRLSYHTTLQNHLQMARTKSQDKIPVLLASSVQHRLSDNQSLSLGVSWQNLNNQVGLNGSWQYHTQNGMSLGAGYRHGTVSNGFDGRLNGREMGRQSGEWFLRLSLNAYKPPASLPKLGRYTATHSTNGQAVITLTHDDNADKSAYEQMFFDVNGRLTSASTLSQDNNKSIYLLDLPKGVHKIGLDGRDLPIQYALPAQAVAKIAPRLPTHINWHISQTYGIRGRLSLGAGQVELWQNNHKITTTQSDTDGYFFFDKLPTGTYTVQASGHQPKQVVVSDDYVVGVVLTSNEER